MNQNEKYAAIHYHSYLGLDKVLDAQHPRSGQYGKEAHDETLFIIIHQVYELWFKQIIHELESLVGLFEADAVDEKNIGIAVSRIDRINEIFKLLIHQIDVLETMTPLDFLEFRNFLFPASGFQSAQFRKTEVMLGLKMAQRFSYQEKPYYNQLSAEQQEEIKDLESRRSLFELIEDWLERTPFIKCEGFSFIDEYKVAIAKMIERERQAIETNEYLSPEERTARLTMLGANGEFFQQVLDPAIHAQKIADGHVRISYDAMIAAVMIHVYRDQPILQLPYRLLDAITTMDELMTSWRYRHAQMVMRMLGKKSGTGGSAGFDYLMETVKKHQIFKDFHQISTLLIPRGDVPQLPDSLKRDLSFYYSTK